MLQEFLKHASRLSQLPSPVEGLGLLRIALPSDNLSGDSYVGITEIFKRRKDAQQLKNKLEFICLGNPTSYSLINLHKHRTIYSFNYNIMCYCVDIR